jgi:hypothetical protein
LVVPALYALWFRVRQDEPSAIAAELDDPFGHDLEPIRIAAE